MSDIHPLWLGQTNADAADPLDRIPYLRSRLESGWGHGEVTRKPDDPFTPLIWVPPIIEAIRIYEITGQQIKSNIWQDAPK